MLRSSLIAFLLRIVMIHEHRASSAPSIHFHFRRISLNVWKESFEEMNGHDLTITGIGCFRHSGSRVNDCSSRTWYKSSAMDENKNHVNCFSENPLVSAAFATRAIHSGFRATDADKGAVIPPIYMTTTYEWNCQQDYMYSRVDNPNRRILEEKLTALEGASYGAVFSSGMAAVNAITTACCTTGDHVIVGENMYGGTIAYFKNITPKFGIDITWVDMARCEEVKAAIRPRTKFIWLESLSNPMLVMVDIKSMRATIDDSVANGATKPLLVVDNTFMTPYFMNPLELGADVVVHSATKYLNGHCDVLLGAVLCSDETFDRKLKWLQQELGGVPSPLDCNLVIRGLKTLHLRMDRHMQSGLKLAKFLERHPCISKVYHPGLTTQSTTIQKQRRGYPGMLTFEMKGSTTEVKNFLRGLKIAIFATSLGSPETLVCLVNAMFASTLDHIGSSPDWMKRHGLIRVSVGLEDPDDLIGDFDRSLRAAFQ